MSSEAGNRAQYLIQTLRTMRKWGFSIIQDEPGKAQDKADQLKRARIVAFDLLEGAADPGLEGLANVLLECAESGFGSEHKPREAALSLAERMIEAAVHYKRPESQAAYFDGLVAGWHQGGLLSIVEMQTLRDRLRENLPRSRPLWQNIASSLGLCKDHE